jgi:hypothetical protein
MPVELFTDPRSFFDEERGLAVPLSVVGLMVGLVAFRDMLSLVAENPLVSGIPDVLNYYLWDVVGAILVEVGVVLYFVVGFYGLGRLLGGDGDLSGTMAVVGWGYLPQLFAVLGVLSLVVARLGGTAAWVVPAWTTLDLAWRLLPAAMFAVSVALWYHGVAAVQGLERGRVATVVAVTTAPWVVGWYVVNAEVLRILVDAALVAGLG